MHSFLFKQELLRYGGSFELYNLPLTSLWVGLNMKLHYSRDASRLLLGKANAIFTLQLNNVINDSHISTNKELQLVFCLLSVLFLCCYDDSKVGNINFEMCKINLKI